MTLNGRVVSRFGMLKERFGTNGTLGGGGFAPAKLGMRDHQYEVLVDGKHEAWCSNLGLAEDVVLDRVKLLRGKVGVERAERMMVVVDHGAGVRTGRRFGWDKVRMRLVEEEDKEVTP